MKKIYALAISAFVGVIATFGFSPTSHAAAILDVVGGELIGAKNVNVTGTLYDVSFTDGTCIGLFSGCDNAASDFNFPTADSAFAAATALVEQVFIDTVEGMFGSDPELTRGCEGQVICNYSIPYLLRGSRFDAMVAQNLADDALDTVISSFAFQTTDYFALPIDTFAVFSLASGEPVQVGEPGTLLLLGVAMLGLGVAGRRNRRRSGFEA